MRVALGITSYILFLAMVDCTEEYNAHDRKYFNTGTGMTIVPRDIPEGAVEVYFHGNNIKTLYPFSFMKLNVCKVLDLSVCLINTIQPRAFNGIMSLEILKLSHNNLSHIQDHWFPGLHALQELHLDHSGLHALSHIPAEAFKDQGNLKVLNLDGNNDYETSLKRSFHYLSSLLELRISRCKVTSIDSGAFLGLKKLQVLTLNYNRLKTFRIQAFLGLESVKTIELLGNQITTLGFDVMAALPRPLKLDLYDNPLICDWSLCWLRIESEAGSITWTNNIQPECDVTGENAGIPWNMAPWNCSNYEIPVTKIPNGRRSATSGPEAGVVTDSGSSAGSADAVPSTDVVLIAATSVGAFVGGVIVTVIVVLIWNRRRTPVKTKPTKLEGVNVKAFNSDTTARPPGSPPALSQAPDSVYSVLCENNHTDQEHEYINDEQIGQHRNTSVPDLPPESPCVLPPTQEVAEEPGNQSAHVTEYELEMTIYNQGPQL